MLEEPGILFSRAIRQETITFPKMLKRAGLSGRSSALQAGGNRANRISAASAADLSVPVLMALFRTISSPRLFHTWTPTFVHPRPGQNAGLSALTRHERWCLSRSNSVLSSRSSFCRAWLRNPASRSPSRTFGRSGLLAAATASSSWIHILHIIGFYLGWSLHL